MLSKQDSDRSEELIEIICDAHAVAPIETKIESMTLATEPCPDCGSGRHRSCESAPVETRQTAEQLAVQIVNKFTRLGLKGRTIDWEVIEDEIQTELEAFRDKSEAAEIESLRATNRELNRRCQALTHTINTNSDRKTWYGYYQATLSILGWEEEKFKTEAAGLREENERLKAFVKAAHIIRDSALERAETAEAEAAALRERCETFVEHTCTGSVLCEECGKALSTAPKKET